MCAQHSRCNFEEQVHLWFLKQQRAAWGEKKICPKGVNNPKGLTDFYNTTKTSVSQERYLTIFTQVAISIWDVDLIYNAISLSCNCHTVTHKGSHFHAGCNVIWSGNFYHLVHKCTFWLAVCHSALHNFTFLLDKRAHKMIREIFHFADFAVLQMWGNGERIHVFLQRWITSTIK